MMERRAERFASRLQRLDGRCPDGRRPFRGRGRPGFMPDIYSHELEPHRDAPPFPEQLRAVLDTEDPVHVWALPGDPVLGMTAVRLANTGDCAIAVIRWNPEDAPEVAVRNGALQTVGLALALALLGALVAMPIVLRIRRLEDAVRGARDGSFDLELGGNDEINALADAFRETLAASHERERALEEYIGNTTHDLAIPLTVLQHRLRKLADSNPSEDIRVALEESHYISSLISNMRVAAKLESPDGIDLSNEVNLSEIVERVVQRHTPIATPRGVELNFGVPVAPVLVRGEPTLIEQALSNLVQNAVQYNSEGGHVSIVLEDVDDGFEITVADDGPGIPEAMREQVLQRGVRDDDARTRNAGGQGFGLAIVRQVAQLHHWTLSLEHDQGLLVRLRPE